MDLFHITIFFGVSKAKILEFRINYEGRSKTAINYLRREKWNKYKTGNFRTDKTDTIVHHRKVFLNFLPEKPSFII